MLWFGRTFRNNCVRIENHCTELLPKTYVYQKLRWVEVISDSCLLNPCQYEVSLATMKCQWFLNLLSNQALTVGMTSNAWFSRRFKNHLLLSNVVTTHFKQDDYEHVEQIG